MNYEQIAKVAHEVNRAYCQALNIDTQVPWEKASEHLKGSVVDGVAFLHGHPNATPEDSHKNWLKKKDDCFI